VHDRAEIERTIAVAMQGRWRGLLIHASTYALVMTFLLFVNVMTTSYPWMLWPAASWGLGLAMHFLGIASRDPEKLEREVRAREQHRVRVRVGGMPPVTDVADRELEEFPTEAEAEDVKAVGRKR
jgi:hypothetical protein